MKRCFVLLMCTRSKFTNRRKGEIKEPINFATHFHGINILWNIYPNFHPHIACERAIQSITIYVPGHLSKLTYPVVYKIIYKNCFISRCYQFDWPTRVFMWWHIDLVYTIVYKNRFVRRRHKMFARIIIWRWRMSWFIHPSIIQLHFHHIHIVIHVFCTIRFHMQVTRRVHFRLCVTSRSTGCSLAHTGVIPHRSTDATCCNCIFPGVVCCGV